MAFSECIVSELKGLTLLIQKVSIQIETIESSIQISTHAEDKKSLLDKEKQLRDERKQLRDKEILLLRRNQGTPSVFY